MKRSGISTILRDVQTPSQIIDSFCVAAKLFLVLEPARNRFEELPVQSMSRAVMSELEQCATLGPQARHDLRDPLHEGRESPRKNWEPAAASSIPSSNRTLGCLLVNSRKAARAGNSHGIREFVNIKNVWIK